MNTDMNDLLRQAAGRGEPPAEEQTGEPPAEVDVDEQEARVRTAFLEAAERAGVRPGRADAAWRLVSLAEVEYEDDGSPRNAADLIARVREEAPELFDDPRDVESKAMNFAIRQAAGRTSDENEEE